MIKKSGFYLFFLAFFLIGFVTAVSAKENMEQTQAVSETSPLSDAENNTYDARVSSVLGTGNNPQLSSPYLKRAFNYEAASNKNKNTPKNSNYKEVMPALSVMPVEIEALVAVKSTGAAPVIYTSIGGLLLAGGAVIMAVPESTDETKLSTGLGLTLGGALMVFDGVIRMLGGGTDGISAENMQKANSLIKEYNTYVNIYNAKVAELHKGNYYEYIKKGDNFFAKGEKDAENYKLAETQYLLAEKEIPTGDIKNKIQKAKTGYASLYYEKYMAQGIDFMKSGKTDIENYNRALMNFEKAADLKNTDEIKNLIIQVKELYTVGAAGPSNKGTDASGKPLY